MGYRKGTRYMFKRQFRHKGVIALSQYLQPLKVRGGRCCGSGNSARCALAMGMRARMALCGLTERSTPYPSTLQVGDYVDVVANSSQQKGMPHKYYHGKTGIVYNVTRGAVGVELNKQVRGLRRLAAGVLNVAGSATSALGRPPPPPTRASPPRPRRSGTA